MAKNGFISSISILFILCAAISVHAAQKKEASSSSSAEYAALKREIQELKESQNAMQKRLLEIKDLLTVMQAKLSAATSSPTAGGPPPILPSGRPAPPTEFNVGVDPVKGNLSAKVVLIEFSDYQCPYCGSFEREMLPQIQQNYIQNGKIKYVFHNLPLIRIHQYAAKAAEAAACSDEQGKFWEMHDRLFQNQNALDAGSLPLHAQAIGLNVGQFNQCLTENRFAAAVRSDMMTANAAGLTGTPSFIIGLTHASNPKDPNVKVYRIFSGSQTYATFQATLDSALASAGG